MCKAECKTITVNLQCCNSNEEKKSLFIPQGQELVFKTLEDQNDELVEGDYVIKNISGEIVSGFYMGGDKEEANNYN